MTNTYDNFMGILLITNLFNVLKSIISFFSQFEQSKAK